MVKPCAFIVIDSGFSQELLWRSSRQVLAAWDLSVGNKLESAQYLSWEQLQGFAGDPMGHGSIVLGKLLDLEPSARLILVKAFHGNNACRTRWLNGKIASPGWSEAYVWACNLAEARSMSSVANCSFGAYVHAMDGSGWEKKQVAEAQGSGGHILVAAAGPGDARAVHGAIKLCAGEEKTFEIDQDRDSDYNLWFALGQEREGGCAWTLSVRRNGELVFETESGNVPDNFWNGRQQLTFRIPGNARVQITVSRHGGIGQDQFLNVDAWCESARFRNWVSGELIPEPACFEGAIAVGLAASSYSPFQTLPGRKPEILLPGSGQISFRLPEVAVRVARHLEQEPNLTAGKLRGLLSAAEKGVV